MNSDVKRKAEMAEASERAKRIRELKDQAAMRLWRNSDLTLRQVAQRAGVCRHRLAKMVSGMERVP